MPAEPKYGLPAHTQQLGAEIEHARIPQRVGEMLEEVGVDANTARRVTKAGFGLRFFLIAAIYNMELKVA